MITKKNNEDTLAKFFNIDSPEIKNFTVTNEGIVPDEKHTPIWPKLVESEPVETEEMSRKWKEIQAFYRGDGAVLDGKEKKGLTPVILSSFQEHDYVSKDFPFWINGNPSDEVASKCISLDDVLRDTVDRFCSEERKAKILKQNLVRIVGHCSKKIQALDESVAALPIVMEAIDELKSKIEVNGDDAKQFEEDIALLKSNFPENGYLIPFSEKTIYEIFNRILNNEVALKSTDLLNTTKKLVGKLNDLLAVEREKETGEKLSKNLKSSIGFADSLINIDKMSSVNPESGSELMTQVRAERIKNAITILEKGDLFFEKKATILAHKELYSSKKTNLNDVFSTSEYIEFTDKNGCEEAVTQFNTSILAYEKFISSIRIAQLEVEGKYIESIHDAYFSGFEWRMFTDEEMACFPPVILITELSTLKSDELTSFSKLMSQNIPIKIISLKRDSLENYKKNGVSSDATHFVFRQELAAIAIAHRNTYVLQSSTISPEYLFQGLSEGLRNFSPALFNILCPSNVNYSSPYMWGSAAVESRDFPQFKYNGNLSSQWGSRFDVSNNPQTETNWPLHSTKIITSEDEEEVWELPFTIADYTFINTSYSAHYLYIDSKYWNDKLIPLADYLSLDQKDVPSKVPFIWVVDEQSELQKMAVSISIVLACKERLDFWDYLQENAGIHNYHVDEAIERERNHFKSVSEEEIAKVRNELNEEIERVREKTTEEAMEKLTSFLLDMDNLPLTSAKVSNSEVVVEEKEEADLIESTLEEEIKEEKEEAVIEEPWIETPSCTTCNECTDINDRMFSYNADKMAYVADPKAGTFKELVDAAVLCPVHIIHPGKPLNANEPNLEELIKIAEEYN
ncbi:MAG: ferredoxin [Cyclobacteriaceae bacterium]|nr:ferredoxin [Cyclobacteriaceae bacterium]